MAPRIEGYSLFGTSAPSVQSAYSLISISAFQESVGFRACQAIFDDFRLIQGGESGVWLGQMSISPTQKQVKRAKIEPKHLNPTDSQYTPLLKRTARAR